VLFLDGLINIADIVQPINKTFEIASEIFERDPIIIQSCSVLAGDFF
jgi:hypothetical protein